jgi:radical SAM superfamily enzyme YgiQ (UPF0313 family)
MKKSTISLIQPNFRQGPGGVAAYLPYSVGILWSYCLTRNYIKENLELDLMIWKREPIEELAPKLAKNDIVAFSTYVWNRNYNFKLAQRIKEINPKVFIFFGGPEPPITKKDIFSTYMPFCDVVIRGEGEYIFADLIEKYLQGKDYTNQMGLLINQNGVCKDNGPGQRINDLDEVPSPYLTGVFDKILPYEKEWNTVIETNRGCPYKCTFCDWGSLTYSKIKKFGLTRVFHELEWMAENKIGFLDVADANFGIFVERDNMIVDKLIEVQQKAGYPYRTGWSWAKNQKSEVVQIAKKLITSGHFNNGLTISLQSLDDNTLETIKRKNMGVNKINELFDECKNLGVPLNVELILGLPSETKQTWENTLYGVFEVGQHDSIEVWQAQLIENAEMNLSQKEEYNIRGTKVLDYFPNSLDDEAPEFSEIVVSNSTMSLDEMVDSYKLAWFLITWHTGGFSQYVSRFLKKYLDISYQDFYSEFRQFLQQDKFWKEQENHMSEILYKWFDKGEEIKTELGPTIVNASTNQYRTLFKIHLEDLYEKMYDLLEEFLQKYELDSDLKNDLIQINRCIVARQRDLKDFELELNYNLHQYIINSEVDLINENTKIKVTYPHDPIRSKDLAWFMESIFYARRRSYGKNYLKTI